MDSERNGCPICGSATTRPFGERAGYALGQCRECAHSFVRFMPTAEELERVYARYSYDTWHLDALPAWLEPIIDEKVRRFRRHRRTGRLLDVGFGAGALLRSAKKQGWSPFGIETSALAVEQAKAKGLGEIVHGDFLKAPFAPAFFDVIVMSELVEHLPEPSRFVRMAKRLLAPGGLLYLTTPHGRGVSGRVLRETWSVCAPPEHLHLFSKSSMRRCLDDAGFGRIRIEARNVHPHELLVWAKSRLSSRRASSGAVTPTFSAEDRGEGSYRLNSALVGSWWGRLAKRAANRVLDVTALGDGLEVFAVVQPSSRDSSAAA